MCICVNGTAFSCFLKERQMLTTHLFPDLPQNHLFLPIAQLHLSVYTPHTTHNSSNRSDEGLTLETSAFESLYGGQFTLSTQLIKPNYLVLKKQSVVLTMFIHSRQSNNLQFSIQKKILLFATGELLRTMKTLVTHQLLQIQTTSDLTDNPEHNNFKVLQNGII